MYILKKMGRMPFQNFMQDNMIFVIKYEPFGVKRLMRPFWNK